MISNAVLFLISGWEGILASLITAGGFQDVAPNTSIVAGVSTASGYVGVSYSVLPITTVAILAVLVPLLLFESGYGAYKILKWGYSKIPGIT